MVHDVSTSIQASHIILVIAEDLSKSIPDLYPVERHFNNSAAAPEVNSIRGLPELSITREESRYIQSVDLDTLIETATRNDFVIEAVVKPGDHSISRSDLAIIWGHKHTSVEDQKRIADAFRIGGQRTSLQDIRFQFQQLTDVIVRALSPGINDPFTAINGIDALTSAASQLARRPRVHEVQNDSLGKIRVILATPRLEEILLDTVGHIALYAANNPFVMDSLRRVLQAVKPDLGGLRELETLAGLEANLDRRERGPTLV